MNVRGVVSKYTLKGKGPPHGCDGCATVTLHVVDKSTEGALGKAMLRDHASGVDDGNSVRRLYRSH